MAKTRVGFQVQGTSLVMHATYASGAEGTEVIGVWLPADEEHTMRLMARVFTAGRNSKLHEIKGALRED